MINMAVGRPSKLTDELCKEIVDYIKQGNYPSTAACLCGVAESTFYQWMKLGRERKTGKFVEFMEAVRSAEKFAEAYHIQLLRKAAEEGNVGASKWWLTNKFPEHWGKENQMKVEHSGEIKQDIKADVKLNLHDRIKKRQEYYDQLEQSSESDAGHDNSRE